MVKYVKYYKKLKLFFKTAFFMLFLQQTKTTLDSYLTLYR
ncbi:hypothetical protein RC62_1508 [Flavobacterium aquidurense]|uniref:Uncharacterized protein n=1 Tax=Flavobacterium aquidurense TaxID=362413 RepID=A0A0Q0W616_9FLAO|nr:hypothetical protein RC62_1508 [Flavobacterium aquidurense]